MSKRKVKEILGKILGWGFGVLFGLMGIGGLSSGNIFPAIILFIATILHMLYYSLKNFLVNRSIQRDNENLVKLIRARLLNEKSSIDFKSSELTLGPTFSTLLKLIFEPTSLEIC